MLWNVYVSSNECLDIEVLQRVDKFLLAPVEVYENEVFVHGFCNDFKGLNIMHMNRWDGWNFGEQMLDVNTLFLNGRYGVNRFLAA